MKEFDAIAAKHDRLAAEQRANPRTEWPPGTIRFVNGDEPDCTTGTISGRIRAREERERAQDSEGTVMSNKLLVGLGNPGEGYAGNRHNIGFMVLDALARKHAADPWRKAHKGLVTSYRRNGHEITLLKPMTYMNLSGPSVASAATMLDVPYTDVVVVHDELDLAFGELRLKNTGGVGGHNGLKDIFASLALPFGRVRVGVGRPSAESIEKYVLSDFTKDEQDALPALLEQCVHAIDTLVAMGFTPAMNRVNTKAKTP